MNTGRRTSAFWNTLKKPKPKQKCDFICYTYVALILACSYSTHFNHCDGCGCITATNCSVSVWELVVHRAKSPSRFSPFALFLCCTFFKQVTCQKSLKDWRSTGSFQYMRKSFRHFHAAEMFTAGKAGMLLIR